MLIEINELRKENNELRQELASLQSNDVEKVEDIADFDAGVTVNGETRYHSNYGYVDDPWEAKLTWRKLFSLLAPYLMEHPSDNTVKSTLARVIADDARVREGTRKLNDQQFKTISIQLKALGLVSVDYTKTLQGGAALFWSLTPTGEQVMMRERIVKKTSA